MVSGINNSSSIEKLVLQPQFQQEQPSKIETEPLTSFDGEDKAIISSEAKLLNELDKYNSGQSDELNLALARVNAKTTVSAEVNVINAKKDMIDETLKIGK